MADYRASEHQTRQVDRRSFLGTVGGGFAGLALATLLADEHRAGASTPNPVRRAPGVPHFAPRAKQVLQIFVSGAISQIDTFDYKPGLEKYAGKAFEPGDKVELFESEPGKVQPSYWPFKQYGKSGKWVSSLFPKMRVRR